MTAGRARPCVIVPVLAIARVAAVALAAATIAGCGRAPVEQNAVVTVETAVAADAPISSVITADAVLYPRRQAAIVPKIAAPVERFSIERGDRVRKGQVLAVLEHGDLAGAAEQARGQYERAQAAYAMTKQASVPADRQKAELDVTTTKQALDAAQKVYDDRQTLFKQGAIAARDLESASVALADARSQYAQAQQHLEAMTAVTQAQTLNAAEADLAAAKGQYDAAVAELNYATIVSPIDGVVTDRPFYVGETAPAGAAIVTVMDLATVVARAPLSEDRAAALHVGDSATVTAPGVTEPVRGRVIVVSPALDPSSTTAQVWVEVSNADGRLTPGVSVRVSITARTVPHAVIVPAAALVAGPAGTKSVMVVGADHKAHTRPVETGIAEDGRVQIVKGLDVGEVVVTTGAYGLDDGTLVKPSDASGRSPAS